eukprot:4691730-Amphidinium_carterae.1
MSGNTLAGRSRASDPVRRSGSAAPRLIHPRSYSDSFAPHGIAAHAGEDSPFPPQYATRGDLPADTW